MKFVWYSYQHWYEQLDEEDLGLKLGKTLDFNEKFNLKDFGLVGLLFNTKLKHGKLKHLNHKTKIFQLSLIKNCRI